MLYSFLLFIKWKETLFLISNHCFSNLQLVFIIFFEKHSLKSNLWKKLYKIYKEAIGKKIFCFHSFILRHKSPPEIFLTESKIKETSKNKSLFTRQSRWKCEYKHVQFASLQLLKCAAFLIDFKTGRFKIRVLQNRVMQNEATLRVTYPKICMVILLLGY